MTGSTTSVPPTPEATVGVTGERQSWARTLVSLCALFALFQLGQWTPTLLAPAILLMLATASLLAVLVGWRRLVDHRLALWFLMVAVVSGAIVTTALTPFLMFWGPAPVLVSLALSFAGMTAALVPGRRGRVAFVALVLLFVVVALGHLVRATVVIDVQGLLEGGIDAVLNGDSPYGITIPNPYPDAASDRFYGPGVLENGQVMFGYPYLPAPLLIDIPAHLLGDVRWAHVAAAVGAGALAWGLASDLIGRAAAVLIVVNPLSANVLISYWIEPVLVLLLALVVWGMVRGNRWTGLLLGLLFASKQYAVCYVPALWSVARSSGWRTVWTAVAVGGVIVGAFAFWNPRAFVHSAIEFQFIQPFRDDSMSLLPGLADAFGPIPEWMLTLSPLLGLLVSLLVALRTKPGATAFLLGVGLSLLFMVLLSKQAFMNYHYLAGSALLLAVITWPRDDPIPDKQD